MKSMLKIMLACSLFFTVESISAQKIKFVSGDLKPILDEKEINVQYDYSNMKIGKSMTAEEEYVNEKVIEKNKNESGAGDTWKTKWFDSRKGLYQPKFEELVNKEMENKNIIHGNFPAAKYTLLVHTVFTEPGYNIGVMKQPSYVNFEFTYIETANTSNVVAKMTLDKVAGSQAMGFDYDTATRLSESYAKGGKVLGKYLNDAK